MSRTDTLRNDLSRLSQKEADLHRDLSRHTAEANKQTTDANRKYEAARKAKSASTVASNVRQADAAAKKASDAEKKVADVKRKLAEVAKQKAAKQKSLSASEKSDREAQSRQADRERQKEKSHIRQIDSLSHAAFFPIRAPKPEPLRVLYLTANPEASVSVVNHPSGVITTSGIWLRTDAEVRNVLQELKSTPHRDRVNISHLPAATYEDMLQGMNEVRPHVIHFSGHGGGGGVLFDNGSVANPEGVGMQFDKLSLFLSATDDPPRLLVLNACDTLAGAEVLLDAVPIVIAMSDSVSDIAAAAFAAKFYAAIASAQSVGSALNQGKAILSMLASSEAHLPQYLARDGVDIAALVLVKPE